MNESKSVYILTLEGYNAGTFCLSEDQVRVFKWLRNEQGYDIELEFLDIKGIKEI